MENAVSRKIRLKNLVERGQAVDMFLSKFGDEWYSGELRNVLNEVRDCELEELPAAQSYLKAVDRLHKDMRKAVDAGKRAAERLHKEVTDNA